MSLLLAASGTPLTQPGLQQAIESQAIGTAELWSVLSVETSGCGFLADRRPKILFERHIFSRLTNGRFDADDPDISAPSAGGYGPSGAHQFDRLNAAMQLDQAAALQSASWGLGQIMGENYGPAGFATPELMVTAMVQSEDAQLLAMASFLAKMDMIGSLQAHDWSGFARRYNGPDYAANNYDGLLANFYHRYSTGPTPDLTVRSVQVYLLYQGYSVGAIDGVMGPNTRNCIAAFQGKAGLEATGEIDPRLLDALRQAATAS